MKNVYYAVRTGSLNEAVCAWSLKGLTSFHCVPVSARYAVWLRIEHFVDILACWLCAGVYNLCGEWYKLL